MEAGIDDVGIGVLYGLNTYRYDFIGLLMHAEHLEATFGVGPHTISVPRLCDADDIDTDDFANTVPDDIFRRIVAVIRIAVPYTGMIVSTRESQASREKCWISVCRRSVADRIPVSADMSIRRNLMKRLLSSMFPTAVLWTRWCRGCWI